MQMMKNELIQMVENINVLPNINSQLPKYLWRWQPLSMNKTTCLKYNNLKRWQCWHLNLECWQMQRVGTNAMHMKVSDK